MPEPTTPPNPEGSQEIRPGAGGGSPHTVPDPTLLTIDALRREIAMAEAQVNAKFDAIENLMLERVKRIDALMERAEEMRKEQKTDTRSAVAAALDSQKEATAKMETTVSDQIHSLRENFETSIRGVHSSVADLKDRMTILESVKQGIVEQKTETRQATAGQLALIGVGLAGFMALMAVLAYAVAS